MKKLQKLTDKLSNLLMPIGRKLQSINAIAAIGETMQATMPIIIIGSFAVLFTNIDIGPWQSMISTVPGLVSTLGKISSLTSGAYSLFVLIVLSYIYGQKIGLKENVACIPVTVAVFLLLSPLTNDGNVLANTIGTQNLITAILVGLTVPKTINFLIKKNVRIHMPNSVPKFVEEGFTVLVPAAILCVLAGIIDASFAATSFGSFTNCIYTLIQTPLANIGLSFGGYLLIMCLASAIMWPGLHANTIMGIMTPLTIAASAANQAAIEAGKAAGNIIEFEFNMICCPGGQGSLLLPCIIGLLFCKSRQIKQVSRVGIVPAIFGIGEPILFGYPIMFNTLMFIPLILSTLWNVTCWYLAISLGFVGPFSGIILPWTTPPLLNSALASTTPLAAVICHIIMLVVCALIWLPFIRIHDKQMVEKETEAEKRQIQRA